MINENIDLAKYVSDNWGYITRLLGQVRRDHPLDDFDNPDKWIEFLSVRAAVCVLNNAENYAEDDLECDESQLKLLANLASLIMTNVYIDRLEQRKLLKKEDGAIVPTVKALLELNKHAKAGNKNA